VHPNAGLPESFLEVLPPLRQIDCSELSNQSPLIRKNWNGGAVGSTLGCLAYALGGWNLASWIGFALPMLAIAFLLIGWVRARAHANA